MAEIIATYRVEAYSRDLDANENCLVAWAYSPTDSKLFRVSPETSAPATVRMRNGEPDCKGKSCSGSCVHVKAVLEALRVNAQ